MRRKRIASADTSLRRKTSIGQKPEEGDAALVAPSSDEMNDVLQRYPWGIALHVGGAALMLAYLAEGVPTMEGQHWIMLVIILVVGYVLGRIWTAPAQMIGLP